MIILGGKEEVVEFDVTGTDELDVCEEVYEEEVTGTDELAEELYDVEEFDADG